jgi:hypothetical protein
MNTGIFGTMDFTIVDDEYAKDRYSSKRILAP